MPAGARMRAKSAKPAKSVKSAKSAKSATRVRNYKPHVDALRAKRQREADLKALLAAGAAKHMENIDAKRQKRNNWL